ncbi:MAG: hypothetical protein KBD60_07430 [Sterolibacterium sp.]|nr:hypothetical protein [Sterolibacterium sp.]
MHEGFSLATLKDALLLIATSFDALGYEKALGMLASLIFVGVFILQFFSIYRHGGRDAVVSLLTWVLVACLCASLAGYYWQQQRDFFQVVLLLILTAGALSCFLLSIVARSTLNEEVERRKGDAVADAPRDDQFAQVAKTMRERIALARQRDGL